MNSLCCVKFVKMLLFSCYIWIISFQAIFSEVFPPLSLSLSLSLFLSLSFLESHTHIHARSLSLSHTHTRIYIWGCVYVCVCVCVLLRNYVEKPLYAPHFCSGKSKRTRNVFKTESVLNWTILVISTIKLLLSPTSLFLSFFLSFFLSLSSYIYREREGERERLINRSI